MVATELFLKENLSVGKKSTKLTNNNEKHFRVKLRTWERSCSIVGGIPF